MMNGNSHFRPQPNRRTLLTMAAVGAGLATIWSLFVALLYRRLDSNSGA